MLQQEICGWRRSTGQISALNEHVSALEKGEEAFSNAGDEGRGQASAEISRI